jgi:hypothetical protein
MPHRSWYERAPQTVHLEVGQPELQFKTMHTGIDMCITSIVLQSSEHLVLKRIIPEDVNGRKFLAL